MIFFIGTQLANHLVDQLKSSFSSQWLTHHSTMNSIEVDRLLADEVRLKHWILQYTKPNTLAKDIELVMECTMNSYP
jgi:hypothetical protein